MNNRRQAVEAALRAWRDAERKLAGANGDAKAIRAEIALHRDEFQRQSTDPMVDPRDALVSDEDATQARNLELEPTGG
jgi:hypothetical protein